MSILSTIFESSVPADENVIYFATWAGEIKSYSGETDEIRTFVKSKEQRLAGIAWDPKGQHLYFSSASRPKIFRANADGTGEVEVFNSSKCKA